MLTTRLKNLRKSLEQFFDHVQFENTNIQNRYNEILGIKPTQILTPHTIPPFIDIDILKEYVKKDIGANKEYFDDLNITYKISDPKKAEWILSKSIKEINGKKGKLIGDGNTNADIRIGNKILIDVSVLTLNKSYTNEKSIMQNFTTGNNLDTLFNNKLGNNAVDIFKDKLRCKYNIQNKKMYYMIFVCHQKSIYLVCLEFHICNIGNMAFDGFSTTCKNIMVNNFIDHQFGNVKLYKSKKRLELRLNGNIIHNPFSAQLY